MLRTQEGFSQYPSTTWICNWSKINCIIAGQPLCKTGLSVLRCLDLKNVFNAVNHWAISIIVGPLVYSLPTLIILIGHTVGPSCEQVTYYGRQLGASFHWALLKVPSYRLLVRGYLQWRLTSSLHRPVPFKVVVLWWRLRLINPSGSSPFESYRSWWTACGNRDYYLLMALRSESYCSQHKHLIVRISGLIDFYAD